MQDDFFYSGDPRRCPVHPGIATSSPDGMHDAPCGQCEYDMYVADITPEEVAAGQVWAAEQAKLQAEAAAKAPKPGDDAYIPF